MAIQIHGKQYVTVDERVKAAHEACQKISISTEVLPIANKRGVAIIRPKTYYKDFSCVKNAICTRISDILHDETSF